MCERRGVRREEKQEGSGVHGQAERECGAAHQAVAAQRLNIVMTPLVQRSRVVVAESPLFPRSRH
jgi:hypothetical protein